MILVTAYIRPVGLFPPVWNLLIN